MTKDDLKYRILIKGQLDPSWEEWFEGFRISRTPDKNTLLIGGIVDQAALHGVFKRIRNLGLIIISLTQGGDK